MANELVTIKRPLAVAGFQAKPNGLIANKGLTREQWEQAGNVLFAIEGCLSWYVGDWLAACKGETWGYGDLAELCERMGWNYGTAKGYKSVSDAYELSKRFDNLSFTHHMIAQGPDQDELLQWAVENNATTDELRQEKRRRRDAVARAGTPSLPTGVFNLIYADPPWRYDYSKSDSRKIENQYPTMEVEDICELGVQRIAAPSCVLFLWGTSPKLPESMRVIDAWGFTYRTCMIWRKDKIGMGYYARQQHELLLIATQGEPGTPTPANRPPSVVDAARDKHSRKPAVFYDLIESMYPASSKVELFCREPRDGWSVWGNEV